MRLSLACVAILLVSTRVARCQAVRGVVITRDSAFVPGAIISLLDSAGNPVARALADDEGRYLLRAPAPGSYRLEVKRLAFRPTLDDAMLLEAGKVRLHTVVLTGAAVPIAAVHVTAEARCETNPDSGSSAFLVWEEARKALRASQLTRLTRAYRADITTYIRRPPTRSTRVPVTDSTTHLAMPIRPFSSRPAQQLADDGYLTRTPRSATFHAPDEDVLLSESFAAAHCLSILPDSGGAEAVRLAFKPALGGKHTDIAGVLTIDRISSELRRLDFSYVNLPGMDAVGAPGGEIVFRRLPEGSWLISDWAIWLPVSEQVADASPNTIAISRAGIPIRSPSASQTAMRHGLETTGGYVTRVRFGDETVWTRPAPARAPER